MSAYIIAEMAWSHTGSLNRAMQMLEGAARAGADAISVHITDMPSYMVQDYKCIAGTTLSESADQNATIYDFLCGINLSRAEWLQFDAKTKQLEIDLIVMCNDRSSFEFSKELDVRQYVLSAATFLEFDLVEDIVRHNPNIILRTGGATLAEVDRVVDLIFATAPDAKPCLLAGIQLYPTPIEELHLASLRKLVDRYKSKGATVGLADHIDGDHPFAIYLPALALAFGAQVLEKHITTDRKEKLEDYEAALGIEQFAAFVNYVRTAESALDTDDLAYMDDNDSYRKYRLVARKKVVAANDLPAGTLLCLELLAFMRADHGAQLDEMPQLIGRTLKTNKSKGEGINIADVLAPVK